MILVLPPEVVRPSTKPSIREETPQDFLAREALLDRSFGTGRGRKTCERLREDRLPAPGLAFSAHAGPRARRAPCGFGRSRPAGLRRPAARPHRHRRRPALARPRRQADPARPCCGRANSATRRSCWSATRPITSVSAFRALARRHLDLPGPVDLGALPRAGIAARRAGRRQGPRPRDRRLVAHTPGDLRRAGGITCRQADISAAKNGCESQKPGSFGLTPLPCLCE